MPPPLVTEMVKSRREPQCQPQTRICRTKTHHLHKNHIPRLPALNSAHRDGKRDGDQEHPYSLTSWLNIPPAPPLPRGSLTFEGLCLIQGEKRAPAHGTCCLG